MKLIKFNFTLYEKLDTLKIHITNLFNTKTCLFSILKFQFETNHNSKEPNKYHAQGFVKIRNNKQLHLGNYNSKTNKESGIKEIFKANVHVEFANGTDEEYLAYCRKFYNCCKNPAHNPNPKKGEKCECDLNDLSKFCNESCERTFAHISKDLKVAGPFEFIFNENKFNSELEEKKDENYYIKTINEVQKGSDIDEVIDKYAPYCEKWAYTPQGLERVAKPQKKTINPLKDIHRFWELCVIYIYGNRDTGKSDLCKKLFPGLYKKDDIKQFKNYNNDEINYNRDTAILINDFYNVKYSKTNVVAMYICITANSPIKNLYKNLRECNSSIDIKVFIRRVRYIIKFEGDPIDSRIGKGDITHIFEKGNKQDFNNRIFDIEFNRETTLEQAKKRQSWKNKINKYSTIENIDNITNRYVKEQLNNNIEQEQLEIQQFIEQKQLEIKQFIKQKQIKIQQFYQNLLETKNNEIEKEDNIINKLNKRKNYQLVNLKQNFDNTNAIDQEQIQIHQKLLEAKKNIVENNNDNFNMQKDIELDISEETAYEEFNRKNKNNSLYLGLKYSFNNL
ncbi:hypothetical protein C2G38_2166536 [Gigaspora rosea]|uniref:Helicase superfamily 3 single-stranded DNA/RNA virus domain-containing protein n=1 Tax=Gigaspora rosea TaxID=44941 RepID=A0A397VTU7_9GLOM|nr:hypothetical protein C2G38_2166536 [Gigaspora rosea]